MKAALGNLTNLEVNREMLGNVLGAGLWIEHHPAHAAGLGEFGVLGRMIELGPCLVEPAS